MSDLLGEATLDITVSDRWRIRDWREFLRQRLMLDSIDEPLAEPPQPDSVGIQGDRPLFTTEVVHSIRDVRNGALQVVRVIGDSMSDLLLDGYKVLVERDNVAV